MDLMRTKIARTAWRLAVLGCSAVVLASGCDGSSSGGATVAKGVVLEHAGMDRLHAQIGGAISSAPVGVMGGTGVAGAQGGARVKLLKGGKHEVLMPLVQLTNGQVPLVYTIETEPKGALVDCRVFTRRGANVVAGLQIQGGKGEEIAIDWAAIILMVEDGGHQPAEGAEPYLAATSCVQSGAEEIGEIADELWPSDGNLLEYSANIQRFVGSMQQKERPRSLDALGILKGGGNKICTANANLAAALLRAKKVPARSLAVIPVTSQKLEMHRSVEWFDGNGRWVQFDPSSLHADIPVNAWQNIVMATTTVEDERDAMKPRMGAMVGCPYGHELELVGRGVTLWGQEFFWTVAKPLAQFEMNKDTIEEARKQWMRFLDTGRLSPGQFAAAAAREADALRAALEGAGSSGDAD